jgi:hypothetical protein
MKKDIVRKYKEETIQDFILSVRGNRIYNDPSIQRRTCWTKDNKLDYELSIIDGTDDSHITLCDIKSSMDYSYNKNNTNDYEYFSKLLAQGYRFISIDGGNRTDFLIKKYESISQPLSDESYEFFTSKIFLVTFENMSKSQLHSAFLHKNSGNAVNTQEARNCSEGVVSEFVRKVGSDYRVILSTIQRMKFTRMKDLEFVSQCLLYHQSKTTPLKDKGLNFLFKKPEIFNQKEFSGIIKIWAMCMTFVYRTNSKIYKTFSFNLFMFLLEMSREYNCILNKDMIDGFVDKYLELENKRKADTIHNEPISNWDFLSRSMEKDLPYKFNMIYNDFKPFIGEYFYELDKQRLFTETEKIIKHIENGYMVTRLDGTIEHVTILQMLNGKFYNGGHKKKPYSKGGKKTMDNLEIQSAFDNKSQSNRH